MAGRRLHYSTTRRIKYEYSSGSALGTGAEVQGEFTKRGLLIPSFYKQNQHKASDADSVVTKDGVPIMDNGETLTISLCAPEKRYAIGPAEKGFAEVVPQHVFSDMHYKAYMEFYRIRRAKDPGIPEARHIPTVEQFVRWKIDPANDRKIIPLGQGLPPKPTEEPTQLYSPTQDRMIDRSELEAASKIQEAREEKLAQENAELKRRLDALEASLTPPEPDLRETGSTGSPQSGDLSSRGTGVPAETAPPKPTALCDRSKPDLWEEVKARDLDNDIDYRKATREELVERLELHSD